MMRWYRRWVERCAQSVVADASVTMANGIGDLLDQYADACHDPIQRATYREAADIARVSGQEIAEKVTTNERPGQ